MTLVLCRPRKSWLYFVLFAILLLLLRRGYLSLLYPSSFQASEHGGCKLISKGISDALLLKGTVLAPDEPIANGYVLVRSGKIAEVGTEYQPSTLSEIVTVIDCTGSVISPGFINLHEHIPYSSVSPFKDIGERVQHRHDWRCGARNHTMREALVREDLIGDSIKWGELRHIFSGTTSLVGGGMVVGLTRNLDFAAGLEADLLAPPDVWDVFPLDDVEGILRNGDCDYGVGAIDRERARKYHRYLAHIGEGIDEEAANEFRCLSNDTYDNTPAIDGGGLSTDIIAPNLAMIHALGLSEADFDLVADRGAHVVWSPRSNVALYGRTLNISYLLEAGINVALGTDWLPSGSATMAREAVCASSATRQMPGHELEPKTIWRMMTINAARAAGFEEHIGALARGKLADIAVFGGNSRDPFAQAVFAPPEDIQLVLRGGQFLVAAHNLRALASKTCEYVRFGHSKKVICVAAELGSSYRALEASLDGVYPAILPGTPPDEPSCDCI